jgi:hypothetical protein
MKTVRKTDIESMERELSVLRNPEKYLGGWGNYSTTEDENYVTGNTPTTGCTYDPNDCWWRCIAYLSSCGSSYSASDAYNLASAYYGSNFNSCNYAFNGSIQDMRDYVSGFLLGQSNCSGKILVFNPNNISGWGGNNNLHAVIVTGYSGGYYQVFDPQSGQTGSISASELNVPNAQGGFIQVN